MIVKSKTFKLIKLKINYILNCLRKWERSFKILDNVEVQKIESLLEVGQVSREKSNHQSLETR